MQNQNPGTDSHSLIKMETISALRKWFCFVRMASLLFYPLRFILNISRDSPHASPVFFPLSCSAGKASKLPSWSFVISTHSPSPPGKQILRNLYFAKSLFLEKKKKKRPRD